MRYEGARIITLAAPRRRPRLQERADYELARGRVARLREPPPALAGLMLTRG